MTTAAAGQLLGLERRQVLRLLKAYRAEGATGLISKRRGRRSNRRKPEALQRAVLAMIREWYWDFGPTLMAEKLREVHGIALGRATSLRWMIEAGLWLDRKQRRKRFHQPRLRRLTAKTADVDSGQTPAPQAGSDRERNDDPSTKPAGCGSRYYRRR